MKPDGVAGKAVVCGAGTKDCIDCSTLQNDSAVLAGTLPFIGDHDPPLKRWAIFNRPSRDEKKTGARKQNGVI